VVADADQRFGRDPAEALGRARFWRNQVAPDTHHAFTQLIEAKALADRGQDPEPTFRQTLAMLEELGQHPMAKDNPFFFSTLGQALLDRGRWEWTTRRSGRAAVEQAVAHLEGIRSRDPNFAYTFYHLPRVHALLARMALANGQDPWPHARAAVATGKQGQAINPKNANLHMAAADAHLSEGQAKAASGANADQAWADCRAALAAGERANPRDYRFALLRAELELAEAESSRDPGPHLRAAETACRAGLALKRDEPGFHRLLARIGGSEPTIRRAAK
jgi:hypothetical protein